MPEEVAVVPEKNRAYRFAWAGLIIGGILAGIVLIQSPGQWSFILAWFKDMYFYVFATLVGVKEAGKMFKDYTKNKNGGG